MEGGKSGGKGGRKKCERQKAKEESVVMLAKEKSNTHVPLSQNNYGCGYGSGYDR